MILQQEPVGICPVSADAPARSRSDEEQLSNKPSHDLMCLSSETHSVPEIILLRITAEQGTVWNPSLREDQRVKHTNTCQAQKGFVALVSRQRSLGQAGLEITV